jgi:hypothetical protein
MKRRNFLQGATLSLLTLPAWLGCAFQRGGSIDLTNPDEVVDNAVSRAFLNAQKIGKPLMVVVIPKDATQRYDRGHAWGEYLNYGFLWPMALCEVICANEKEISELGPVSGEPLFYLIDSDAGSIKVTPYNTKMTPFSQTREYDDAEEGDVDVRIRALGKLVGDALAKDNAMLQERAALVEVALKIDAKQSLLLSSNISIKEADRFAAIIARNSPRNTQTLELAAQERLKAKKIEGSRWTHASPCGGDTYEDATEKEQEDGVSKCGMGYIPAKSERFLTFFTDTSTT